jgi:6-phosphofructokinase 1
MRIGLLTGGGDCPGLNAVIRAVVKTAIHHYNFEVFGIFEGFDGLLKDGLIRPLSSDSVRGILPRGGTILGTTNRSNPFEFRQDGRVIDRSADAVAMVKRHGLDALIVVGGDGTLKIAHRFFVEHGIPVVGIPKTIDNDLNATDVTFGFATAVNTASEALDRLHTTAESHHRAMLLEVMGRYAGWIALEAGMAGGADFILIPEIPYDIDSVVHKIDERKRAGSSFSIGVVAEGAFPIGGSVSVIEPAKAGWIAERLGGAAHRVAEQIGERLDMEVRVTVLGHLQRGGSPIAFDRNLGTLFGTAAVDLIAERRFDHMVCLRGRDIESVPIPAATGDFKMVDPNGPRVRSMEKIGIDFGRAAATARSSATVRSASRP